MDAEGEAEGGGAEEEAEGEQEEEEDGVEGGWCAFGPGMGGGCEEG
jgi:hypothetical protein